MASLKVCNCCGEQQSLDAFFKHSSYSDGHRSECKACCKKKASTPEARKRAVLRTQNWQARNLDRHKAGFKRWYANNREKSAQTSLAWRTKNRERHLANTKAWVKRNYQQMLGYAAKRRARIAGGGGSHTIQQWRERLEYFNNSCAYCLRHESECGALTRDHIKSLFDGGSDDIENIAPACRRCNFSKGPRNLLRFLQLGELSCP